jgi:hypothetical protein
VRIRLSMVNTPERGEDGYNEATKLTESVCPVGADALVDEEDDQKEGSYDSVIGTVSPLSTLAKEYQSTSSLLNECFRWWKHKLC